MSPSPYDRKWIVWHPDGGEEGQDHGRTIMASSAMTAADAWADEFDFSDNKYTTVQGEPQNVFVCKADQTGATEYKVSGRIIRRYHAEKIEPPHDREVT